MHRLPAIRLLFVIAAVYDGLLGLLFLFLSPTVFQWFQVTPPNHMGYVQFSAALLLVFALMFLEIARDPFTKRNLIPYGILLKVSYSGVVIFHWIAADVPNMWKPFAVLDLLFIAFFVWSYRYLAREGVTA